MTIDQFTTSTIKKNIATRYLMDIEEARDINFIKVVEGFGEYLCFVDFTVNGRAGTFYAHIRHDLRIPACERYNNY